MLASSGAQRIASPGPWTLGFSWREHHVTALVRAFVRYVQPDGAATILMAHGYLPAR